MKIAIMGAGAVGSYYGARLALAGHDVLFVARGDHAAAMRRAGLQVRSELGDVQLHSVNVVTEPAHVGPVDLVVVAVKLWDTEIAARAIVPMVGDETAVLSLQNGVEKDDVIAGAVGAERVLGAVTYILVDRARPGVIAHSGTLQRVLVGELRGPESARVRDIVGAFAVSGVDAAASSDIRRNTWEKFVFLASSSAVTAATRETFGPLRTHPATRTCCVTPCAKSSRWRWPRALPSRMVSWTSACTSSIHCRPAGEPRWRRICCAVPGSSSSG